MGVLHNKVLKYLINLWLNFEVRQRCPLQLDLCYSFFFDLHIEID